MGSETKSITIRDDQAEWIDEHPEIKLSGMVQVVIDRQMEMYERYGDIAELKEPDGENENGASKQRLV